MKKFLLAIGLIVALCAALPVAAQVNLLSVYNLPSDTVTNTGTVALSGRVVGSGTLAVQVVVTEISGTTAGTVSLHGSLDGTSYALIDSVTFSPADVTSAQGFIWKSDEVYAPYYRVTYTGSGTMAARFSAKALVRKK